MVAQQVNDVKAKLEGIPPGEAQLEAHLFFFERRPPVFEGNLLLNQLLGAKMQFIPFGGGGDASMTIELTNRLVRLAGELCTALGQPHPFQPDDVPMIERTYVGPDY